MYVIFTLFDEIVYMFLNGLKNTRFQLL